MTPAVEMSGIVKKFPSVIANWNVDLSVESGEVHALIGENGAGKSTLMKILYGLQTADSGTIKVKDKEVQISEPRDAIALGIGMVHQHFMLIPTLSVAENVFLGMEPRKGPFIDQEGAQKDIEELSKKYGLKVDPKVKVGDLPVGLQQRVEIIKVLYRGADTLILDEPTAILTPQEVADFFGIISELKDRGKTIILITHKLQEVMAIADRVTVMRRGKVVAGGVRRGTTTKEELARLMVGRPVLLEVSKKEAAPGKVVLEVDNVSALSSRGLPALKGVSFNVREGEILGVAGIEGNGQTELLEVLSGLRRASSGKIMLCGKEITHCTPRQIFESHEGNIPETDSALSHIPEDRQRHGLIMDYSVEDNLILGRHYRPPFSGALKMNFREIDKFAKKAVQDYDIRPVETKVNVRSLSGGNQQKLVVARELSRGPKFLIAAKLTRGVDIGAIEFIHKKLIEARDSGIAILLVSSELSEVISLSDRILVMYAGEIVGIVDSKGVNEQQLGLMMTGIPLLCKEGNKGR